MASAADLEIGLYRWDDAGHYAVDLRYGTLVDIARSYGRVPKLGEHTEKVRKEFS